MKKISQTVLALAMVVSLTSFSGLKSANAFGVVNLIATGNLDYVGMPRTFGDMLLTTACIVLLPVCILDGEQQVDGVIDAQSLRDSGLNAEAILAGQAAASKHLRDNAQKLSLAGENGEEALRNIPGMTEEYVQFAINNF